MAPSPGRSPMMIDELAAESGFTTRNIRAYQSRGLLRPPVVRSRTGFYDDGHLDRLRQIRDLQAEGFNLKAIGRLLELPITGRDEAVGFRTDLLTAFGIDGAEVIPVSELDAEAFGDPVDRALLAQAERAGALRMVDPEHVQITNPTLFRAARELIELGIPLSHVLAVGEAVAANSRATSKEFVRLFVQDILVPLERQDQVSGEDWVGARDALAKLRPLANEAVLAAFEQAMARSVEREVERRVGGR